jgi:hypothetical protein
MRYDTWDDVALLIDIGQAGIHRRGRMGSVLLIMAVRVEATHIVTHAKL